MLSEPISSPRNPLEPHPLARDCPFCSSYLSSLPRSYCLLAWRSPPPSSGLSLVSPSPDRLFEEAYKVLLLSCLHSALPHRPHSGYSFVCRVASERDQDAGGERAGTP